MMEECKVKVMDKVVVVRSKNPDAVGKVGIVERVAITPRLGVALMVYIKDGYHPRAEEAIKADNPDYRMRRKFFVYAPASDFEKVED